MTGRVVKGIGGFYFVHDGNTTVMGKARGNLKRNKEIIYVGDIVDYDIDENDSDNECVINRVVRRKNYLTRPPVSNLDMLVVVFSIVDPEVNYPVIDKLIAGAEYMGIEPVVCVSKIDLVTPEELEICIANYWGTYPLALVDGITGEGIRQLREIIRGKSVALAGPSGVGKSTITNQLTEDHHSEAETGSVSNKTGRGRHTTRHVEIFPLSDGTSLYDTPGFTSIDLPPMDPAGIRRLFPEFRELEHECRYRNCMHINEPDCAVKEALAEGRVSRTRYESYLIMTEEAKRWQRQ